MAILGNFEVIFLRPTQPFYLPSGTLQSSSWEVVAEHNAPDEKYNRPDSVYCQRYIPAYPAPDSTLEVPRVSQFGFDFKCNCGFEFADGDETEFLVFRVYHDDHKIGSGFLRRSTWERPGTYRVRKTARRFWLEDKQRWVESKWHFDEGLHGTIKVELWRERQKPPSSGTWNHPDLPVEANEFGEYIDLTKDYINLNPRKPRVRHTSKIDPFPMATFVFEYRPENTLRLMGLWKEELPPVYIGWPRPNANQPDTRPGIDPQVPTEPPWSSLPLSPLFKPDDTTVSSSSNPPSAPIWDLSSSPAKVSSPGTVSEILSEYDDWAAKPESGKTKRSGSTSSAGPSNHEWRPKKRTYSGFDLFYEQVGVTPGVGYAPASDERLIPQVGAAPVKPEVVDLTMDD